MLEIFSNNFTYFFLIFSKRVFLAGDANEAKELANQAEERGPQRHEVAQAVRVGATVREADSRHSRQGAEGTSQPDLSRRSRLVYMDLAPFLLIGNVHF